MSQTIFIVETDPYAAEMLADALEIFQYKPVIFNEKKDLGTQLTELNPYMVIINKRLYQRNKPVFVSLKATVGRTFNASLIITSGILVDPQEIRELEADYFLYKPYDINILSDLLQKIEISKRRSEVQIIS